MLPGAVLAAAFMDQVLAPRFPRSARVTAVLGALLALACSARIHQDAVRWRRGPEWAHGQLSGFPGVPVVTDWRTAQMLRMLSGDGPSYALRSFNSGDPPPASGTLLLKCDRTAEASLLWDRREPPPWWTSGRPPRDLVSELRLPGIWRLRGPRGPEELTAIRRVRPAD